MRISDWSSDVGSSDLQIGGIDLAGHVIIERQLHEAPRVARHRRFAQLQRTHFTEPLETRDLRLGAAAFSAQEIGSASCRAGVWRSLYISGVAEYFNKQQEYTS